jgi:hypothetical protein
MGAATGLRGRGRVRAFWLIAAGALAVGLVAQPLGVPAVAAQQRGQGALSTPAVV